MLGADASVGDRNTRVLFHFSEPIDVNYTLAERYLSLGVKDVEDFLVSLKE